MTSIRAVVFLLLWGCLLCVQASAQGDDVLRLGVLSRLDYGSEFLFEAMYSGPEPPVVQWSGPGYRQDDKGKTTFRVKKSDLPAANFNIQLILGDLKSQYFKVAWDVLGSGNRSAFLNVTLAHVTPGTDLVYVPGTTANVNITVTHFPKFGPFELIYKPEVRMRGTYMKGNETDFSDNTERPFYNVSYGVSGNETFVKAQFREKGGKLINGYFLGHVDANPTDLELWPLIELSDYFVVKVHDKSHSGPFPARFIEHEFSGNYGRREAICYRSWSSSCTLHCSAMGNDVQGVQIFKAEDGPGAWLPPLMQEGYSQLVQLEVDRNNSSTPGDYVCLAMTKDQISEKRLPLIVVD